MKRICHMSILERAEFTDKIANAIMSSNKEIKKGDAFIEAVEVVKQMENRENKYNEGDIAI
ncbi:MULTISPECIES: hypothetical protein [unclassified Clostridioides]|uniref:hypothetical protein n=1 Tax=unclassified Clostridioides TaxID=2635829 RepID=UPI001D0CD375|nr:hypothetical protein [Clostridioides sp. ES-S-0001-03]MCC0670463.1 hypothetical protein [Clostridioides sp. ES-S-0145-01]